MAQVKGTTISNQKAFIVDKFGEESLARFLEALPPDIRTMYESSVVISWVPTEAVRLGYQTINRLFGDGSTAIYHEIGAWGARRDLPRFFKTVLGMANPGMVFEFLGSMWRIYYNSGKLRVVDRQPNRITVHLVDFNDACEEICSDVAGFSQALLETLKIRNPRVRHTACQAKGSPHCVFEGEWEDY